MKYFTRLKINQLGFSHLVIPLIAIVGVAIVGTYLVYNSQAASSPYSGECTSTIISTTTVVTTSKYKGCIASAQELMDAIQKENYDSYKTAIESVPYTTTVGTSHYLAVDGVYNTATAYAVKALPGNKTNNALTNSPTTGTWQILCSDAVGAGLAKGGKAASYILYLNANVYDVETNAAIFQTTCGNLPSTTTNSGSTNSGGSSTATAPTANKGTLPSGSTFGNNSLEQWKTALMDRATKTATWVAWGDSITEGQGATTVTDRWVNLTLNALRNKYPVTGVTGGFGYVPSFYGTYDESQWSTDPTTSGNVKQNTKTDSQGNQEGDGAGLGLRTVTIASGGSETFKTTGTSVDILYNHGTGTFSYKVDSGAATNVSASGSGVATGSKHVAFASAGSHTVTITGVSGSVVLEGIMEYNGDETKGIRLYEGAQSGATSGEFVAQAANLAAITAETKADLVTIELGANDYGYNAATPAQLTTNLETMVKDIRSASTGHDPSIVLISVYPNDYTNSLGYTWSAYNSAIDSAASAESAGVIDLNSFGVAGVDDGDGGLLASDGLHPSDTGQVKIAGMVAGYLEDE